MFTEQRLVGQGLAAEEVMSPGRLGCGESFLDRGLRLAIGEVFPDRAAEQERVLEDDAEFLTEIAGREAADVVAVDRDSPLLHVVEAAEQAHERRLARARAADDADHLPGRHRERHIVKHGLVAVIAERDVLEADFAPYLPPGLRSRRLHHERGRIE